MTFLDAKFLFDNQLIAELENLIKNSDKELLIISPFIDLDNRIKNTLKEKIEIPNFKLKILYGKNEDNVYKSVKKDSLDFFKSFPNVEIRYEETLHAKFYMNHTHFIMTSLNLYDFSLANNIESGIMMQYTSKGILGKFDEALGKVVDDSVSLIKQNVLGFDNNDVNPIQKFNIIFNNAELKYQTEQILKERKGISKFLVKNEILDKKILTDKIGTKNEKPNIKNNNSEIKILSASKISKTYNIEQNKFIKLVEHEGMIKNNKITEFGKSKGLIMKNYMGREYIGFPENLDILNQIN